jgi:endonuclease/exonuclease/phosphatase family metal-dependent hydrolase
VRLATFNILNGRSPDDDHVDVDRFAAAIRTLDADILGLQEVDRDQPRSLGADLTSVAAEAMGAAEHRFVAALAGTPGLTWEAATGDEQPGTASYGIALLSRFPVIAWQVLRLPPLRVPVPMRHGHGWPHLARDEARVAVLATIETVLGNVTVAVTHLSYIPAWNVAQLRKVSHSLSTERVPVVLMGDLNMQPALVKRVTAMQPLAAHPTFPARRPDRQIDHILGRGIADSGGAAAIELPLSDHRALVVDVFGLEE